MANSGWSQHSDQVENKHRGAHDDGSTNPQQDGKPVVRPDATFGRRATDGRADDHAERSERNGIDKAVAHFGDPIVAHGKDTCSWHEITEGGAGREPQSEPASRHLPRHENSEQPAEEHAERHTLRWKPRFHHEDYTPNHCDDGANLFICEFHPIVEIPFQCGVWERRRLPRKAARSGDGATASSPWPAHKPCHSVRSEESEPYAGRRRSFAALRMTILRPLLAKTTCGTAGGGSAATVVGRASPYPPLPFSRSFLTARRRREFHTRPCRGGPWRSPSGAATPAPA